MPKRPDRLKGKRIEYQDVIDLMAIGRRAERARLKRKVKGLARYNEGRFIMLSGSNGEWIKRDDVLRVLEE